MRTFCYYCYDRLLLIRFLLSGYLSCSVTSEDLSSGEYNCGLVFKFLVIDLAQYKKNLRYLFLILCQSASATLAILKQHMLI